MEFRRYVEKRGAVYFCRAINGLLGRKHMRKVPIMTEDIDEEVFTRNCRQYVLRPNRSDYPRMRWGIVAGAGLQFVPFGFIYGFALLNGWANRPGFHGKILPQFPMAGIISLLGIALAVVGFKKIHMIGKSETCPGLPQISVDRLLEKQKEYKE